MLVEGGNYNVRELIKTPTSVFEDMPDVVEVTLAFDDGEIKSTGRELIVTRHLWELYKHFPNPVILKHHHLRRNNKFITPETDSEILNDIYWDNYDAAIANGTIDQVDVDATCLAIYDIADSMDSFTRRKLQSWALGITYTDFTDYIKHPAIAEAQKALDEKEVVSSQDIVNVYQGIKLVTKKPGHLSRNMLTLANKTESIKFGQFVKLVGPNGVGTDVDSHMFPHAIRSSFVRGLQTLVEVAVESRTAAMSTYYQHNAMQESEYLTRRVQDCGSRVWNVYHGTNCGTTNYEEVYFPEDVKLKNWVGKYYLDPRDNTEKPIKANDHHLRGTTVKYRSVLKCKLPSRTGVCARCYGQLTDSIMHGDSIGFIAPTIIQSKLTQKILSNKHLVGNAAAEAYIPNMGEAKSVRVGDNPSLIYARDIMRGQDVRLVFSEDSAKFLQDIHFIDDIDSVSPARLTSLEYIRFDIIKNFEVVSSNIVNCRTEARIPHFTSDMLKYIKEKKWFTDADGNYEVSLIDWDYSKPILELPMVQLSTPKHMFAVRDMIITSAKRKDGKVIEKDDWEKYIAKAPSPSAAAKIFYNLVTSSLDVNMVHIETFILSMTIESNANNDYRIPLDKSKGEIANFVDIMCNSDLTLAIAYENHYNLVFSKVGTYTLQHRHPHPSNSLLD